MRLAGLGLLMAAFPLACAAGNGDYLVAYDAAPTLARTPPGYHSVTVNETAALQAVASKGGLWIPLPTGGRVYLAYQGRIMHPDGTWTFIGKVSDPGVPPAQQEAVITFGQQAAFGKIPTASGQLTLSTWHGSTWIIDPQSRAPAPRAEVLPTSAKALITARNSGRELSSASAANVKPSSAVTSTSTAATANNPATVDLLVAYTPEFVSTFGSTSAAIARIEYDIDLTNQAFKKSQVYGRIRLVHTTQTTIPESLGSPDVLMRLGQDLTIRSMVSQYGADMVAMVTTPAYGCGAGQTMGSELVWADDGKGTCDPMPGYGLAMGLGTNFGLTAQAGETWSTQGVYPFSYAYQKPGSSPAQGTLMIGGYTIWPYFSNPNINLCDGGPCGVPDVSDAARSLNLTLPTFAAYSQTKVPEVVADIDGDGLSDLLWRTKDNARFAYWTMSGAKLMNSYALSTATNLKLVAKGDFNGDGYLDLLWTDGSSLWMWLGNGTSFTSTYVHSYPGGWSIVGAADVNADGKTDLLWQTTMNCVTTCLTTWIMNGPTIASADLVNFSSGSGWRAIGVGDFDGDGKADVLWTNGSQLSMFDRYGEFGEGYLQEGFFHAYPAGWTLVGTGDVNGDGKADLIWRDSRPGSPRAAYWLMDGQTILASWANHLGTQWQFGGLGDMNGDGLLDVVWHDTSSIVLWVGNGTTFNGQVVHSYPTAWVMLP